MKIAFQMEPMGETKAGETHTLALMGEACRRGHEVYHYEPQNLSLSLDGLSAPVARVEVDTNKADFYSLGFYESVDLSKMDVIFFRQDPPVDMAYITNTYLLERLRGQVLFVNDPYWVRNMADKISIFDFAEYMPLTLITSDESEIDVFFAAHEDVVMKPLYGFHGHGIERSSDVHDAKKKLKSLNGEPLTLQPFLPEIFEGNKRIVFFDGEVVGAIKSIPPTDEFRVYRGSTDVAYELNAYEVEMCEKIRAVLKERELMFVGIDLIGQYLTEINVGSVGSILRLDEIYGENFSAKLFDVIEAKVKS